MPNPQVLEEFGMNLTSRIARPAENHKVTIVLWRGRSAQNISET